MELHQAWVVSTQKNHNLNPEILNTQIWRNPFTKSSHGILPNPDESEHNPSKSKIQTSIAAVTIASI